MKCIKCGYVNPQPTGDAAEACPACGVIYSKAQPPRPRREPSAPQVLAAQAAGSSAPATAQASGKQGIWLIVGAVVLYLVWRINASTEPPESSYTPAAAAAAAPQPRLSFEQQVHLKVVQDSIDRFNLSARHGSQMDRCVQAGFVVAAVLQAKMEEAYAAWKVREDTECAAAGLRR